MILDADIGLYIGVGFSLLLVIFKSQRAHTSVLGNIPGTNIFENVELCEQVCFEFQVYHKFISLKKRIIIGQRI